MSFVDNLVLRFRSKRGDNCSVEAEKSGGAERAKSSYAEYVTPACHYDDNTLLNKGGELVQIIEVVDSACADGVQSLRDGIRKCISSVKDPDVAFWVYTVREKKKFDLEWRSTGDFSDTLHDVYKSYIDEKYETYDNKVYVAVVVKHLAEGLDGMVNALLFSRVMNKHKSYLAKRASYLTTVTDKIMGTYRIFLLRSLDL
ncbi:type IV secretion system VirB4 domain protein [Anaplasma phagocytophilum str. ApNP]|uniref:Type IV secretion system VirB4 domain protein n=2 Tax=Anaplasma phagocytophilum TaxID=948 RepID=A0A0F3NE83_ANAPH|nr:type IV secretion system VirB4 domain protein [Anaplasma phagocytophilum str. ApMUC09]KJV66388.1 type IV secretion system VirB4 domain protein [Anaplasma phagocytophilum str. ApNP]